MGRCFWRCRPLHFPPPSEVRNHSNHLCLGLTIDAVKDFLHHVQWPRDYVRNPEDVNRNGELQSKCGRKQVMGYDLVTFIRAWLEDKGYQEFSVAEVMMSAGHPGVKQADFFLSHCQVELVQTTLDAMSMAGRRRRCSTPAFFLDYFILRQCKKGDFDPANVRRAIGEIGHTVVVLDPHVHPWPRSHALTYQPEALQRLWCVFELYSSLTTKATISGVYTLPGMQCLKPETINAISVEDCKATHDQDKKDLLRSIRKDKVWTITRINSALQETMHQASVIAIMQALMWKVVPFVLVSVIVGFCILAVEFWPHGGVSTTTPGPNDEEWDTALYIWFWVFRQALLSIILAESFAEMKTSGSSICELLLHLCGCRTQTSCLTYPVRLAFCFSHAILGLLMLPFLLLRMLRVCCGRYLRPSRWLRVGTWYASERDFVFTLIVLEMADLMPQLFWTKDQDKKYGHCATMLWWFASLQTVLFVRVLLVRFQVAQILAHTFPPQPELLQHNHV